jgi:hypothetical protein
MVTIVGLVATALLLAVLVGIVSILYSRPATAQTNTGVPGMRQITVVGQGEVKGKPDTATVQIGVDTEAPTAQEALNQNTAQTQAVQAKLKELGIAEKDMQTSNFSIFPAYDADGQRVTGYRVSNMVSVTIRNLDQTGILLDQVVQVGANSVYGISFSVDDPKVLFDQAREAAMQDAKERATKLAQAGGASIGDVLVITENIGAESPIPLAMPAMAEAADRAAVPVQPGEQSFNLSVQVTYALR